MAEVKKVTISGFRGINIPPLVLDFEKDNAIQSMMIYGPNGSGKSSIVDAWEWLCSGRIAHLAREGAGAQCYPHKEAMDRNECCAEIEFSDETIGKIRVEYDPRRITQPRIEGNIDELRGRIPYPCQLRYRDLTEFVYMTKAEKYVTLSRFMGFTNLLKVQDDLQTCNGRLEQFFGGLERDRERFGGEYKQISGEEPKDAQSFLKNVNSALAVHKIGKADTIPEVDVGIAGLRTLVEKDERSQKLNMWKSLSGAIDQFYPLADIRSRISDFERDFRLLKKDEKELSKFLLLELYEAGIKVIEALKMYDKCPLCDKSYDGNLLEHIRTKHAHLDVLKKKREDLIARKELLLTSIDEIYLKVKQVGSSFAAQELPNELKEFGHKLMELEVAFEKHKQLFQKTIEEIQADFDFVTAINTDDYNHILDAENEIKKIISDQTKILEEDKTRKLLVDDFQRVSSLQRIYLNWSKADIKLNRLRKIREAFGQIRNHYVEDTKRSVQVAFDLISEDVVKCFNKLESDCDVIEDPRVTLLSGRDKAVELEILFGGGRVCPAHSILSESQINSFGLSIFLSSIKNFNTGFKFVILDDVINSFDAYKRPRVIDILDEYFSDYQILLLTHDSVWLDRLQRRFPQWVRKHFYNWDYVIGPRVKSGTSSYERIAELISEDNPAEAGRTFGVYLEWILQLLCENLESSVKYNKRNEYTLSDLYQSFTSRMKKKLKETHSVVKSLLSFEADTGFRNFCTHWKDATVPYTSPEIDEIVKTWREIEAAIECEECHKFIRYDKSNGYEHVTCPCRELDLGKEKYYS